MKSFLSLEFGRIEHLLVVLFVAVLVVVVVLLVVLLVVVLLLLLLLVVVVAKELLLRFQGKLAVKWLREQQQTRPRLLHAKELATWANWIKTFKDNMEKVVANITYDHIQSKRLRKMLPSAVMLSACG